MRSTKMDAIALEEALFLDGADPSLPELRGRSSRDLMTDDELGLRRLLEYPEELSMSFPCEDD